MNTEQHIGLPKLIGIIFLIYLVNVLLEVFLEVFHNEKISLVFDFLLLLAPIISVGVVILWLNKKTIVTISSRNFVMNKTILPFLFWGIVVSLCAIIVLPQMKHWILSVFHFDFPMLGIESYLEKRPIWAIFLDIILLGPIVEEIIYRGILLNNLLEIYSKKKAIILSASFFAILHLNFEQMIGAFVFGLFLGICYSKTRSLILVIIFHVLYNAGMAIIEMSKQTISNESGWMLLDRNIWIGLVAIIFVSALAVGIFGICKILQLEGKGEHNATYSES